MFHHIVFCRFVKIKVQNNVEQPSGKFVYGSARARCLAQSAVDEQVLLYLNIGVYISAVEYRVGCTEQPTKLPSDWSQPQQVVVLCRFPEIAEPLRQTATPGDHSNFVDTHGIFQRVQSRLWLWLLNFHPGSIGWGFDNAALQHIPKMSISQHDALGSKKQVAQLQQLHTFCVVLAAL